MKEKPMILDRSRCEVLTLVLKKKWFDLIASGEKKEEYRTAESIWKQIDGWVGRAAIGLDHHKGVQPIRYEKVVQFCLGYGHSRPTMLLHATDVTVRTYAIHPDWGEPDEAHLVITLDRIVEFSK